MKSQSLLVLAILLSAPSFAQTLPDEINYPPHEQRYRALSQQVAEAESRLSSTRQDRQEALRFIQEMTAHIVTLENHIRESEGQIASNQREIPQLESRVSDLRRQITQVDSELRRLVAEEQSIRNRRTQELRNLRPLEENLKRKEQRIRELEGELARNQQQERDAGQRLNLMRGQVVQLEKQIEEERNRQRQLMGDIRSIEVRLPQQQASITQLESQVNAINANLGAERQKLVSQNARVQEMQNELRDARAQAQNNEQIREAERKLSAAVSARDAANQNVRRLETEASRKDQEVNAARARLNDLRRDQQAFPARIAGFQANITQAEGKITTVTASLNLERGKLGALNNRVVEYENALTTLRSQNAPADQIKDAERKLNAVTKTRDNTAAEIPKLESQVNAIQQEIRTNQAHIEEARRDQQSAEARISQQQTVVSQLESQAAALNNSLAQERQRVQPLSARVQECERDLETQRARGNERVQQIEQRLATVVSARDASANQVRQLESQLSSTDQNLKTQRTAFESLRRDHQNLTGQHTQSEARERQLVSDRQARGMEVSRAEAELVQAQRNVQARIQSLNVAQQEYRSDEQVVRRQIELLENLDRQIASLQTQMNNTDAELRSLDQQATQTSQRSQSLQTQIPQLQNDIREDIAEIAQGKSDILKAQNDERTFAQSISVQEGDLARLRGEQGSAESQMSQRLSLYKRYYSEAQSLGASESTGATPLGETEGKRLSQLNAKLNGQGVGSELGRAEARHWGLVRGEVQGHEAGYADGMASQPDIQRGEEEGTAEGIRVAHLEAQTNLKPGFFEEFVLEEFKRPLPQAAIGLKSKKLFAGMMNVVSEELAETIPPLTPVELENSAQLETALDQDIVAIVKDVKSLELKARKLADPSVSYVAPTQSPFGKPDCSKVYKNLAVYIAACEANYKSTFTSLFLAGARSAYATDYVATYPGILNSTQVSQRETSYPGELLKASEVGHAQGLSEGKIEIHRQTYARAYQEGHDHEVPLAREKAKTDAGNELVEFLKVKPLLTVAETSVKGEVRAGEEIELLAKLKNVSLVGLNGPVLLRITQIENAEAIVKEISLNSAAPRAFTMMPALKLKVLPTAKVGQRLLVKGVVMFPGDAYRPQRQESFEINEILSINPAHELNLTYDKNPKVKGVFRQYVHTLSANLKPTFEEIPEGYKVTLTAKGVNAKLIQINEESFETGALGRQVSKEINFSYSFANAAKGADIELELAVLYGNKIIKKERVDLKPR